ncbi:MAG: hypothetical protein IIB19_05955 [Chloroflexi bacterium]|nr:hypothetical protein [Chloroflexota bacterium]
MAQGTRQLSIRAGAMEEALRLMGEDVDAARDIAQQLADRYAELKRIVEMADDVPD